MRGSIRGASAPSVGGSVGSSSRIRVISGPEGRSYVMEDEVLGGNP